MIVIVGESASGKSTVQDILINQYGFKKYPSFTTRAKRENESNGIDYYFVSEEQFIDKLKQGGFLESAKYYKWWYGTPIEALRDNSAVLVLTPKGFRAVKKLVASRGFNDDGNISVTSFYLNVPRRDRLVKMLTRKESGGREDDIEEAYRRNVSDVGMFDGVETEVDFTIDNTRYEKTPSDVADYINAIYRRVHGF